MPRVGVINLGAGEEYLDNFLLALRGVMDDNNWGKEIPVFDYKKLDQGKLTQSCDSIILSPGAALVGLDTDERFERDPGIRPLYKLIREFEGPELGVNAGHEAINCAYGWAIDKILPSLIKEYQRKQVFDLSWIGDPLVSYHGGIITQLSNDYAVLPREKQAEILLQNKVTQLAHHQGYPLISKVDSDAPVYGVQFNIQAGTIPIFKNFFNLARNYLQRK